MRTVTWGGVLAVVGAVAPLAAVVSCGSDPVRIEPTSATVDGGEVAIAACPPGETCKAGRCAVTVPATYPTASGVTVAEVTLRAELATDVLVPYGCAVTVPDAGAVEPVRLALELGTAMEGATLFRDDARAPSAIAGAVSVGTRVEALVGAPGTFGATRAPGSWTLGAAFQNDPPSSADLPSLIRNLTGQVMQAAFWDGRRLFVGSGARVLVYDGVPASPSVRPALVLGQPSLDVTLPGASSAVFAGNVNAIWSDGAKLAVSDGNRVLVWNAMPTRSFQPADLVLGQADFVSTGANAGGVSGATLSSPRGLDSDGTRLAVADARNYRVLVWTSFPTRVGQPADVVLGQASLTTTSGSSLYEPSGVSLVGGGAFVANNFSGVRHFPSLTTNVASDFQPVTGTGDLRIRPNDLYGATSVAVVGGGGLAISSILAPRICVRRSVPSSAGPCDFVLGQPNPSQSITGPTSGSTLGANARIFAGPNGALVADVGRILVWEHPPAFNADPPDRVVGQAGFSVNDTNTDYRRISERTLAYPSDVSTNASLVAVADRGNNRVLLYPRALGAANDAATVVLGQPDAASFVANVDQVSASASTLSGPSGVALTSTHLFVADTENHRVLVWTPVPTTSGTPATFVLGQADFTGRRPNRGHGDANADGYGDANADGLFAPTRLATDGTHLFVSDRLNHRVVVWDDVPGLTTGRACDRVLGQPSATSVGPNRGQGLVPAANGFFAPTGLVLEGDSLWVADTENNRLVRWDDATSAGAAPAAVVGQPDLTTITNPNSYPDASPNAGLPVAVPPTATNVVRPRDLARVGTRLFVTERDTHRVHAFTENAGTWTSTAVFGQPSFSSGNVNAGGLGASSLSAPDGIHADGTTLFVADASNHRVLVVDATGPLTSVGVVGQSSFVANGFNQALATSAGGATNPRGMAIANGQLFVAERSRHRVLVHDLPLVSGRLPVRVLGQTGLNVALPNGGGAPSASTLASPSSVAVDAAHVVVADTANHRVLVYPRDGAEAALVLGQAAPDANSANRGGAADATTVAAPEGVATDGQRLVVADTANHRVLVWTSFPTASGQPADLVLGQADFASAAPNGGVGAASATSMALPGAVLLDGERILVADTGNNRILVFGGALGNGAAPLAVIGQPDATTREPASGALDGSHLSGPVALALDGGWLYVAERDANRVAVFGPDELRSGTLSSRLLNASNGLAASGPSGLATERTAYFTSRLFVADTNKDQLLTLEGLSRLR